MTALASQAILSIPMPPPNGNNLTPPADPCAKEKEKP
jgi:hypothetical protein